jgi:hypothetical protein
MLCYFMISFKRGDFNERYQNTNVSGQILRRLSHAMISAAFSVPEASSSVAEAEPEHQGAVLFSG